MEAKKKFKVTISLEVYQSYDREAESEEKAIEMAISDFLSDHRLPDDLDLEVGVENVDE